MYQVAQKGVLISVFLFSCIFALYHIRSHYFEHDTKLVFCDVGQGDGAYIRINNRIDILIDAGPSNAILQCLGKHMPFYDRTIEIAFVSHPQLDHFGGLLPILDRYNVKILYSNTLGQLSNDYKELIMHARKNGTIIKPFYKGTTVNVADAHFTSLWPTQRFIELAPSNEDPNDFSQVISFEQRGKSALFTGDIGQTVADTYLKLDRTGYDILKTPHHGSATGFSEEFLKLADPTTAVISVGRRNRYGHPQSSIIEMLESHGVEVKRTDMNGSILYQW